MRTPYHRLTRVPAYRWWRPLLGALVVATVAVAAALVFLTFVTAVSGGSRDQRWEMVLSFGALAVTLPAAFLAARWAEQRRPGTVSSVDGRLRRSWLGECASWAALLFGLAAGVQTAMSGWDSTGWPGWGMFASVAALGIVLIPFQAAAEEYLFRGWLLQAFGSWMRSPWPGAVISSALFVSIHGYTSLPVITELFFFAMALCWLTVRTGGLEAAIALHTVNNLASVLLLGGAPIPDQGTVSASWAEAAMIAAPVLVYALWIDLRFRKRTSAAAPAVH